MRRRTKILISAIAGIAIVTVLFSLAVHFALSREDYQLVRQEITARTSELTGFDIEIAGPLDLPYALRPTGVFRNIRLSNPAAAGDPLLVASELRVTIALLPLLAGKVRVYEVSLSGVEVNLEIDEQGNANWVTGIGNDSQSTSGKPVLHTIRLEDINAVYSDERTGLHVDGRIDRLELLSPIVSKYVGFELSAEIAGVPIDLEGSFGPSSRVLTGKRFSIDVAGEIGDLDLVASAEKGPAARDEVGTVAVSAEFRVEGRDLGKIGAALDWPLPETDSFTLEATLSGDRTRLGLSEIGGAANWRGHHLKVSGQIADILDWSGLNLDARIVGNDLVGLSHLYGLYWLPESDSYDVAGTVTGNWPALGIRDGTLKLTHNDVTLTASGDIADLESMYGFNLDAEIEGDSLRELGLLPDRELLPETEAYALSGTVRGDWPALRIFDAQSSFERGSTKARGSGTISDIGAWTGIEIAAEIDGDELAQLTPIINLPPVRSRSFKLAGDLHGDWPALGVRAATASLAREGIAIRATGSIDNLIDPTMIDIDVTTKGTDLNAIPELARFDLPATDIFEFEGHLMGSPGQLSVSRMTALVELRGHRIGITGDVAELPAFDGIELKVEAAGANLAELNDLVTMKLLETQDYEMSFLLDGNLDKLRAGEIVVDGAMPGIEATLRGSVGKVVDFQDVDLQTTAVIDSLAAVDFYGGPDLPDDVQIQLGGRLTGSLPNLDFDDMTFRTGDSFVEGSASIQVGDRLSIDAVVSSGILDIRPFLVAAREEAGVRTTPPRDRYFPDEPFDLSYLDGFDARAILDELQLVWSAGTARVESATVELKRGSLALDPMQITREGARFVGHFRLERSAGNRFDADLTIEGVNLATMMTDLGFEEPYEGTLDFEVDLDGAGDSIAEVMAGLNGSLSVFVSEARIPNVNVMLRMTDMLFGQLPWAKKTEEMIVSCAISHLEADHGQVDVNTLYLDATQMRLVGGGTADLATEQLDLRLAPRPAGTQILAHNVDLLVRGSLLEPDVSTTGASKTVATKYGKYLVLGPAGLLVPAGRLKKHPCVGSLQEYREQQAEAE